MCPVYDFFMIMFVCAEAAIMTYSIQYKKR